MTDSQNEERFVARIRKTLDQDVERLEPGTRSRLTRMRHEAVSRRADQQPRRRAWGLVAGLAATAAAVVLLLPLNRPMETSPLAAIDDMEILASSDPLEIYEDLEFYSWLSDLENGVQNS